MKSNAFLLCALAACVAAASCAPETASTEASSGSAAPPAVVGVVVVAYVEGDVRIDGAPAEIGAAVLGRFEIRTGAGARCDLVFDGRNALSIGQNAAASFDLTRDIPEVSLERGGVTSVLKKLRRLVAEDSFVVRTAVAVAGVRGTSFCVWAGEGGTYICACNGRVRTLDAKGSNELKLEAAHHAARTYSAAGDGFLVETAGMEHHTDASVQSVAARIGYIIDWSAIDG